MQELLQPAKAGFATAPMSQDDMERYLVDNNFEHHHRLQMEQLLSMGFDAADAAGALAQCGDDVNAASNLLLEGYKAPPSSAARPSWKPCAAAPRHR